MKNGVAKKNEKISSAAKKLSVENGEINSNENQAYRRNIEKINEKSIMKSAKISGNEGGVIVAYRKYQAARKSA
jgi:hypothetical protein